MSMIENNVIIFKYILKQKHIILVWEYKKYYFYTKKTKITKIIVV